MTHWLCGSSTGSAGPCPTLVQAVAELGERGVGFQSLSDPIDTTNAGGRLVLHMMGALAEFERALIVERTRAGLRAAKRRGVRLGRKPILTPGQVAHARRLIDGGESPRTVQQTGSCHPRSSSPFKGLNTSNGFRRDSWNWRMKCSRSRRRLAQRRRSANCCDGLSRDGKPQHRPRGRSQLSVDALAFDPYIVQWRGFHLVGVMPRIDRLEIGVMELLRLEQS